jgi:pilus assembly protein Flp/PilA
MRVATVHPRIDARDGEYDAMTKLKQFLKDESGATAIEYGLIAAGISLAIISVVNGLGTKLGARFTSINSSLR